MKTQTKKRTLNLILILSIIILLPAISAQEITFNKYGQYQDAQAANSQFQGTVGQPVTSSGEISVNLYAVSYNFFSGALTTNPSLCSCQAANDRIYIQNTGSFGADFTITTNMDIVSVPAQKIHLEPGESVFVDLLIQAACGLETTQKYEVYIKSNLGREHAITRTLTINQCQSIVTELYSDNENINPCQPNKYQVQIENPAPFTETYTITPITNQEKYSTEAKQIQIPAGQKKAVEFNYTATCTEYGTKTNTFEIVSEYNKLKTQISHDLTINRAYDFTVTTPQYIGACTTETKTQPILIKNEGVTYNEYEAELRGAPSFIALKQDFTYLNPDEEKILPLEIFPKQDNEAIYNFDIIIKSTRGDIISTNNIELNVEDCYQATINLENERKTQCSGNSESTFTITNNGKFEETYTINIDGPGYGEPEHEEITLVQGQTKESQINIQIPDEIDRGVVRFTVNAQLQDRGTTKTWQATQQVETMNQYFCTKPDTSTNKIRSRYNDPSATIYIENEGIEATEYEAEIIGDSFLDLQEDELTVQPGEEGEIIIEYYADGTQAQEEYYAELILEAENGVQYSFPLHITFSGKPFIETAAEYLFGTICRIIMTILLILLILTAIFFVLRVTNKKSTYQRQSTTKIALGIVAIIIILLALLIVGIPQSQKKTLNETKVNDPLYIIFHEDTKHTINLNKYFTDPDNDTIMYEAETTSNIDLKIQNNLITLTPKKDWNGNTTIIITATDESGEETKSPEIQIEIVPVRDLSFTEYIEEHCTYINAIILLLILILLILTPLKNELKKKGKIALTKVKREPGYLYFVDKEGDVARTKMARGNKKNKGGRKQKQEKVGRIAKKK